MIEKRFQSEAEGLRNYMEEWIDEMLPRMKLQGIPLEDCTQQLHILGDFVHARADGLEEAWPTLLPDDDDEDQITTTG